MAFEIYGACSEKFEDFLKKMVKAVSEVNHVPYSVLLNYCRKCFSVTLQTFNARLITQAYLVIFDNVGRYLEQFCSSFLNVVGLSYLIIHRVVFSFIHTYIYHLKFFYILISMRISFQPEDRTNI